MTGMAGEFGHMTVDPEGQQCGCGNRGCLEQYASATAIVRMAREVVAGGDDFACHAYDRGCGRVLLEAATISAATLLAFRVDGHMTELTCHAGHAVPDFSDRKSVVQGKSGE